MLFMYRTYHRWRTLYTLLKTLQSLRMPNPETPPTLSATRYIHIFEYALVQSIYTYVKNMNLFCFHQVKKTIMRLITNEYDLVS